MMHKNKPENFARPKQRKTGKRTWKGPKWAKPGAFWVLEGMSAVADGCKRMQKAAENAITFSPGSVSPAGSVGPGRSPQGCRPPRHALRGAQPRFVVKTFRTLTKKIRYRSCDT
jgi:hypothetical protein